MKENLLYIVCILCILCWIIGPIICVTGSIAGMYVLYTGFALFPVALFLADKGY